MLLPALAVLATLQFTWIWNDFLWPLVLTRSEEAKTVMAGINALKGQYNVAWANQAAMAVIASIPTIVVFVALPALLHRRPDDGLGEGIGRPTNAARRGYS